MHRPGRFPLLILLLTALMTLSFTAAAQTVTPRLEQALTAEDFPWRADDGTYSVWVFFRDKGLQGAALQRALDRAEQQLNEKTAWRRAKVRSKSQRLVDAGDLPLHAPYLDLAAATGAVPRRQSRWLNAASYQATADQVRRLAALGCVDRVDLVSKFKRREVEPAREPELPAGRPSADKAARDWSIDYGGNLQAMEQFNVPAVHEMGVNGQGVIIGLLDGGFHPTHESLADIPVLATYDFVNDDENVDNEGDDPPTAKNHGTMTMSTAMGYKPGAHVAPAFGAAAVLAKTEDVSIEIPIEEDNWVAGVEWVETFGVDIISSSLGYKDWYLWEDMDGQTAVTTLAADLAVARGVVVVNSAGNERGSSWNHIIAPADGFDVIAVGAVTATGEYSYFSSPGPSYDGRIKPDVAALGTNNHVADPNYDQGYTFASGTSFSCPLTSGVAALILSRVPSLTPAQVREALRHTASMAHAPNNDYGWGLIDALAAVTYFGPNFTHTPLTDTEDTTGPYTLGMTITDRLGLDPASARVWYRTDQGPWQDVPIWPTGGGPISYYAEIPGQPDGTVIDYYLEASSTDGTTTRLPAVAPDEFFSFRTGADITPPELVHTPLRDQALIQWPPLLACQVGDNLGVDRVELRFALNDGAEQGPILLDAGADGRYTVTLPVDAAQVAVGDSVTYTLTAWDTATVPNQAVSGPSTFHIIETMGVILVLQDEPAKNAGPDVKIDTSSKDKPQLTPYMGRSSAGTIAAWLTEAGYVADTVPAVGLSVEDFATYQAVVLAAGDNTAPVADASTRLALQQWAAAGGKLLVEGGEIGYDALSSPGYAEFAAEVLHAVDWDSDNAGNLVVAPGMGDHPLLNIPYALPEQILITYEGYGDEDAVKPADAAYVVMVPLSHQADAGILVYDDNPAPQSAQTVYLPFNIEAVDAVVGRQLVENTLAYLLAFESPPTASLSGQVSLYGESDHSGVLIEAGGRSTISAGDGSWSLDEMYPGSYAVIASRDGWSTDRRDVVLADGQHLGGVDFTLSPIIVTSYQDFPGVVIPDADPQGVTTTITVPSSESGIITDVSVDIYIQHTWIGDLTVLLISPEGTSVVLHNRTGANDYNILGNWPENLTVDGPGTLADFAGENNAGQWILWASDAVGSDEGQITMWGLNFSLPQPISAAPDDGLPLVTRLYGNVPNPFNPQTEISFDLARGGKTRLDIYDLRGRRVTRLVDEVLPAGTHTFRWDGRDAKGHAVSSGTYLYRLRQGDVVQDRKMLLVR